jgi:hypothetical protein
MFHRIDCIRAVDHVLDRGECDLKPAEWMSDALNKGCGGASKTEGQIKSHGHASLCTTAVVVAR